MKQTNQVGLSNRYEYLANPAHFLDKAFDPLGKKSLEVRYENRRYVGVFDGLGNEIGKQEIDVLNNQGIVRDANGNPTTLKYDNRGNVLEEIDPAGNKTIREYKDPRNPDLETRIIDRRGLVTDREYDARGNATMIAEKGTLASPFAQPIATRFSYNDRNEVTSITNASGATTSFAMNAQGIVTSIANSIGSTTAFTYDTQGRRTSFTDFNGNTTRFEYDSFCPCGSPHKAINADGTYQTFEYNRYGQVTKELTFEANGMLVEQKQTFYDASGRVVREVMGSGNIPLHGSSDVRKFYQGNLLDWEIIVSPESLNADGSLKESPSTPVAQRKSRITEYEYDAADRLIRQTDAMGGIVNFRHDAQGNRVLLHDPVGNITTWTYDTLNRVAEERDPLYWVAYATANASEFAGESGDAYLDQVVIANRKPSGASLANNQGAAHVRSFGYDAEGNQNEIIDRNNRRREFSYDHAGRLLTEMWFAANNGPLVETISFSYDSLGNMLTAQNANSKYTYTYDPLNRLKSVDNEDGLQDTPRVIIYYEYDAQGNVIKTADDQGVTVQSTYSKRNQLETRKWFDASVPSGGIADVANARVDFNYTAPGRQKQIRRYSDLTATTKVGSTDYTYDQSGRVDTLIHKNAVDALLSGYDYGYDFSGLLSAEIRDHSNNAYDQSIRYKYDVTGQLVDAAFSGQDHESYVYDANGNRIRSVNGSEIRNYTTGPANQLLADSVYNYEYDGEGNLIALHQRDSSGTTLVKQIEYNHNNLAVRIIESDQAVSSRIDRTYDVFGRLTISLVKLGSSNADKTVYVWDGREAWMSTGATTTFYLGSVSRNSIASFDRTEATVWNLADRANTIRDMATDSSGQHFQFTVFGTPVEKDAIDRSFAELQQITSNSYDAVTRLYDSEIGRFTSNDSIGFRGYDANLYRYVANSPTNGSDPKGTSFAETALIFNNMNTPMLGGIGFIHGATLPSLIYVAHFMGAQDELLAADLLRRDVAGLLGFEWSYGAAENAVGLVLPIVEVMLNTPVPNPLPLLATYLSGSNATGAVIGEAIDTIQKDFKEVISALNNTNKFLGSLSLPEPPTGKPTFEVKVGGFIGGLSVFLKSLFRK